MQAKEMLALLHFLLLGGRPGNVQPDGAADISRWGTRVTMCGAGGVVVSVQVLLILTLLTDPTTAAQIGEDTYCCCG